MSEIHPTAVIEDGAEIGKDVKIGPFVVAYLQELLLVIIQL